MRAILLFCECCVDDSVPNANLNKIATQATTWKDESCPCLLFQFSGSSNALQRWTGSKWKDVGSKGDTWKRRDADNRQVQAIKQTTRAIQDFLDHVGHLVIHNSMMLDLLDIVWITAEYTSNPVDLLSCVVGMLTQAILRFGSQCVNVCSEQRNGSIQGEIIQKWANSMHAGMYSCVVDLMYDLPQVRWKGNVRFPVLENGIVYSDAKKDIWEGISAMKPDSNSNGNIESAHGDDANDPIDDFQVVSSREKIFFVSWTCDVLRVVDCQNPPLHFVDGAPMTMRTRDVQNLYRIEQWRKSHPNNALLCVRRYVSSVMESSLLEFMKSTTHPQKMEIQRKESLVLLHWIKVDETKRLAMTPLIHASDIGDIGVYHPLHTNDPTVLKPQSAANLNPEDDYMNLSKNEYLQSFPSSTTTSSSLAAAAAKKPHKRAHSESSSPFSSAMPPSVPQKRQTTSDDRPIVKFKERIIAAAAASSSNSNSRNQLPPSTPTTPADIGHRNRKQLRSSIRELLRSKGMKDDGPEFKTIYQIVYVLIHAQVEKKIMSREELDETVKNSAKLFFQQNT